MAKKKQQGRGGMVYSTNPDFLNEWKEGEQDGAPPAEQNIRIVLDKKHRGGKTVTLITRFELPEEELDQIAGQLKNHCGTGGSGKNGEVILQGDHRVKVCKWLRSHGYGKAKIK